MKQVSDRHSEWFVPKFGSRRFRAAIGLLFLPYTGMVLSFAVIGSVLAHEIHRVRLAAIVLVYFLGLGIAAHFLSTPGALFVGFLGIALLVFLAFRCKIGIPKT